MYKLKNRFLKLIQDSNQLKGELAMRFDVSQRTIENWVTNNSPMLTTVDALEIISDHSEVGDNFVKELLIK